MKATGNQRQTAPPDLSEITKLIYAVTGLVAAASRLVWSILRKRQ